MRHSNCTTLRLRSARAAIHAVLFGWICAGFGLAQTVVNVKIVSGNGQVICPLCNSNPVGFYQPLVVQGVDANGAPVAGGIVNWAIASGPGTFAESGANTFAATTDSNGLSRVHYIGFNPVTGNPFQSYTQAVITAAGSAGTATFYENQALQDPLNPNFQPVTAYALPAGTLFPGTTFSGQLGTTSPTPISVQVIGQNGIGIPNVGVSLVNHQTTPATACDNSANPAAGPGVVLTDRNGVANCFPVFGGAAGSGSFVVDIGGVALSDPNQTSPAYIVLPAAGGLNLTVTPGASATLGVSKTHSGTFIQGQQGAIYTIVVSNAGNGGAASGTVTVTDILPVGLSLVSMSGIGWTCTGAACSRADALPAGASYPPVTVVVSVAGNAPAQLVNQATVTGGGSAPASASDNTTITSGGSPSCLFTINPSSVNLPSGSGSTNFSLIGNFTLTATNCTALNTWTAVSDSPRLQVTSNPIGNGGATSSLISFSMYTNSTSAPRTAHIFVGGQVFTVNQDGSTEGQSQRVVRALYQSILGREPDASGWAFWTGGGAPRDPVTGAVLFNQMADGFYTSPEFQTTGFATLSIYRAVLGRLPTFNEWLANVTQIRQGRLSTFQLVNSLSTGLSNTAFVQAAIQNVWARSATSAEVNTGTNLLNQGVSRIDYLNSLIFNDIQFRTGTNAEFVAMLYYTILLRDPDIGGFNFWVGISTNSPGQPGLYFVTQQPGPTYAVKLAIIGQAVPPNPTLLGFLGSPEFQALIR